MAEKQTYQFKVKLKDFKPKMWRTFEISSDQTVAEFAYTLMIMFEMINVTMGWYTLSYHSNQPIEIDDPNLTDRVRFENDFVEEDGLFYLFESDYQDESSQIVVGYNERAANPNVFKLSDLNLKPGADLDLIYNNSYGPELLIKLTGIKAANEADQTSKVIAGAGFGIIPPVDDDVKRLQEFYESFKNANPEELKMFEIITGYHNLDLDSFNATRINQRLSELMPLYEKCYNEKYIPNSTDMNRLRGQD